MFAISVVWVTKTLIVDITQDLMEAVPSNIDIEELLEKMKGVYGVCGVHDLHVWRIGTGKVILTAHVDVTSKSAQGQVIKDLEDMIASAGIAHSTVQLCDSSILPDSTSPSEAANENSKATRTLGLASGSGVPS